MLMSGSDDEVVRVLDRAAEHFAVLAGPARLRILHVICDGEMNVSEIIEATGLSQTNTSQHLALMYRAGLVRRRKQGAQVLYAISDHRIIDLCKSMCDLVMGSERVDGVFGTGAGDGLDDEDVDVLNL